jgi:hypothetical protein
MTGLGLTPAAQEGTPSRPAVVAVAGHLDEVRAAVSAGADIIDLGDAHNGGTDHGSTSQGGTGHNDTGRAGIAAFLADHPGVAVCASEGAAFTRRLATAQATDAVLICVDLASARTCGLPAGRVVVMAQPGAIAATRMAGFAAMVDADQVGAPETGPLAASPPAQHPGERADVAASVAAAALSGWLGASYVRTRYPLQVRRGLDMVAVISGIVPPARAVRGLA